MPEKLNRYQALIEKVFFDHYKEGVREFEFAREELEEGASVLGFDRVKNIGDVPYSFRYRNKLPDSILFEQPGGYEWIILGAGKGRYRFKLFKEARIAPRAELVVTDIPDATPEQGGSILHQMTLTYYNYCLFFFLLKRLKVELLNQSSNRMQIFSILGRVTAAFGARLPESRPRLQMGVARIEGAISDRSSGNIPFSSNNSPLNQATA